MVHSKPPLTFGSPPANVRQGAKKGTARAGQSGESFASYLKEGRKQAAKSAPQAGQAPASLLPKALSSHVRGAESGRLAFVPDAAPARQQAAPQAAQAAPAAQAQAATTQAKPARAASVPSGRKRRSSAKRQTRPDMQQIKQNFARSGRSKKSGKKSPRASGAPITGSRNIGMSRARKGSGKSTMATRAAMDVTAAQAQALGNNERPHGAQSAANAAYDRYTALMGGFADNLTQQSVVTHGLSGKQGADALRKLGYNPGENRSIRTAARRLDSDPYGLKDLRSAPPGVFFGSTKPISRPGLEEGAITAIHTNSHRRKDTALPSFSMAAGTTGKTLLDSFYRSANVGLGSLAAKFESGNEGVAAIGYDRKGGTSYGKYQIASRVGTMNGFLSYLDEAAPDLGKRLRNAGPANTGSRHGRMPTEWRKIAAENPQRFEQLQSDFIRSSHFEPAKEAITEATGVSLDSLPTAIQEVLFSTAVQHGPSAATRIVSQAVKRVGAKKLQGMLETKTASAKKAGAQLITQIYNLRAKQFASSTPQVRTAVRNRLRMEMNEAIQMLA